MMITKRTRRAFAAAAIRERTHRATAVLALAWIGVAASAQDERGARFDGASTHAILTLDPEAFGRCDSWTVGIDVELSANYGPQTFLQAEEGFWLGLDAQRLTLEWNESGERQVWRGERVEPSSSLRIALVFGEGLLTVRSTEGPLAEIEREQPWPAPERIRVGARAPWVDVLHGRIDELAFWPRALPGPEARAWIAKEEGHPPTAQRYRGPVDAEGLWRNEGSRAHDMHLATERFRPTEPMNGYRGTWYANQRLDNEYRWKYSGGLGTYCAKHMPHAVYAKEVDRTFFVYGGARPGDTSLLHLVSFYDHATGRVPKPTFLLDKRTTDAHDNPVLSIDDEGYLWVFSSSHGTVRPSFLSRSAQPYSTERFEHVLTTNFSYPQPWHLGERGFLFLHTRYENGRSLYQSRSRDGRTWTEGRRLVRMEAGHYGISEHAGEARVGLAFNLHPDGLGLNHRTNLYYLETRDGGETWSTVRGEPLTLPLTNRDSETLAFETVSRGELVYLKDLAYDEEGRPAILIVTSRGFASGPENAPRTWRIVHWNGTRWDVFDVTTSDNNYDMGSLYRIDGLWVVIGPTTVGPQPFNPGGEVVLWREEDEGGTFLPTPLTANSAYNHTYVRRPRPWHPGFQAFWADGHGRRRSESTLYFLDASDPGTPTVRVLPSKMQEAWATPRVFGR